MTKAIIAILILCFLCIAFSWIRPRPYVGIYVVKPIQSEYLCAYLYSNGTVQAYIFTGSNLFQPYVFGGRTAIDAAPNFNRIWILDDQNYVWINTLGTQNCVRFDTDSLGNAANDNGSIYGYFFAAIMISKDSTKLRYMCTQDVYNWYHNPFRTPTPDPDVAISHAVILHAPAGKKFKKVAMGNDVLVLTTDGNVYEYDKGDTNYIHHPFSDAVDIACSQNDMKFVLRHDYVGGDPTCGNIYWEGGQFDYVGDVTTRSSFFPLRTLWGETMTSKRIVANSNTVHWIDSANRLKGIGDNAMGEVGNGQEAVNRWDYTDPFAWTTLKGAKYTGPNPSIVMLNCKDVYPGNTYSFYVNAKDFNDSLYGWGRDKSFVLTNVHNNQEVSQPNAHDILTPTMMCPLCHPTTSNADFVFPRVHCGGNKSISSSSTTIGGLDTAATIGSQGYTIASVTWTQTAGPTTILFGTPSASSTTASNLTTGTYKVRKTLVDNNTSVWVDSATITVNLPAGGCNNCWIHHKGFKKVNLSK